jgi:hypothetical protein
MRRKGLSAWMHLVLRLVFVIVLLLIAAIGSRSLSDATSSLDTQAPDRVTQ